MRRNRIIWMILWILSIISISFYGGVISYSFFFVITLVPVFSLLYLLYVFIFFRIYQYTDGGDFVVNSAVPYSFRLINEYHLPFAGVRVRFFEPFSTINDLSDEIEYELMPGSGITRETTIVCHYRGEYEIGIKEVEIQDFFRLLKIKYKNNECRRVTVEPQLVRLSSLESCQIVSKQESSSNRSADDIVTREYAEGDDIRFINWSQSARTGKLMVRQQTGEAGYGVAIIMDAERHSQDPYVYLPIENKILELTIAISLFFSDKNIGSEEYHYSKALVCNRVNNSQEFERYYGQMSAVGFDSCNTQKLLFEGLYGNEHLLGSSIVYMVLANWSSDAQMMVDRLIRRNIHVVVYIVCDISTERINVSRPDLIKVIPVSPNDRLEEVQL